MLLSTVCANELAYMRAANYRRSDGFVTAISGVERSIDAGLDIRFRLGVSAVKVRAHTTVKIPEG